MPPARCTETMSRPASSSGSHTARKSPIEGWDGRREVGRGAQPGVELVKAVQVDLALLLALPAHVQADLMDALLVRQPPREVVRGIGHDGDAGHGARTLSMSAGALDSTAVPTTLVTGGAGLVGSHVARLLARRGDDLRLTVRAQTRLDNLDFEYEPVVCDILDRRAVRRAMRGVERVFHTAGTGQPARRPGHAVPRQRRGDPDRARGGPARRRPARRLHLLGGRDRSGSARRHGRRDAGLPRGGARHPLRELQARGRGGGAATRRARPAGGDRQSRARVRSRRRQPLLHGGRAPFPAPGDPRLRRRGAEHRRRRGRRRGPSAGRRARRGGRALHPGQSQLHPRPAVRRPRSPVGGRAAGDQAAAPDRPGHDRGRQPASRRGR